MRMSRAKTAPIVLASSSPRRRQLLREAGYEFEVVEPPIGEPDGGAGHLPAARRAEALAYFKARSVWDALSGRCVLAGDTVVAVAGSVLGKAPDARQAREMLRRLSGTRHCVITGVALLDADGRRLIASDRSHVRMRELTEDEIDGYVRSGEWVGKAGAYAIQETADRFVEAVDGSFSNVVGLPMELLGRMIRRLEAHPEPDHRV